LRQRNSGRLVFLFIQKTDIQERLQRLARFALFRQRGSGRRILFCQLEALFLIIFSIQQQRLLNISFTGSVRAGGFKEFSGAFLLLQVDTSET
jgi:hypothetical protein